MILDRIAPLALGGKRELTFVGAERSAADAPASDIIAIKLKSVELANAILRQGRRDTIFPSFVEMRSLRIEPIRCVGSSGPSAMAPNLTQSQSRTVTRLPRR